MPELPEQANQRQEVLIAEEGSPGGDGHKRIDRADIGPRGRQRVEVAFHQMEEDTILTPGMPVRHEWKRAAVEGMEGVGYAETFWWTVAIRCS